MSDHLTARLDENDRLAEDATYGPWEVLKERVVSDDMDLVTPRLHIAPGAEFIAHSRSELPALNRAVRAVLRVADRLDERADTHGPPEDRLARAEAALWIRAAIDDAMGEE